MPLEQRWRDYLDSWVIEAKAMCVPYEVDEFLLAVAAELKRLGDIEAAAREYKLSSLALDPPTGKRFTREQRCAAYARHWAAMAAVSAAVGEVKE